MFCKKNLGHVLLDFWSHDSCYKICLHIFLTTGMSISEELGFSGDSVLHAKNWVIVQSFRFTLNPKHLIVNVQMMSSKFTEGASLTLMALYNSACLYLVHFFQSYGPVNTIKVMLS